MAAYAIFFGIIIILIGGLFTIALTEVVNEFIPIVNPYITSGDVSTQYVTYWDFVIALLVALPILILVAVAAWSYVRAIERETGTAASPSSLFNGVAAAIIGIITSIILFIGVGIPAEMVVKSFEDTTIGAGGTTLYDVASPWDMGYSDTVFWMNVLYIVLILPALLGIIVMFLSAIKTQDYDVVGNENEFTQGGYSSPQYISAEEMAARRGL